MNNRPIIMDREIIARCINLIELAYEKKLFLLEEYEDVGHTYNKLKTEFDRMNNVSELPLTIVDETYRLPVIRTMMVPSGIPDGTQDANDSTIKLHNLTLMKTIIKKLKHYAKNMKLDPFEEMMIKLVQEGVLKLEGTLDIMIGIHSTIFNDCTRYTIDNFD
jgi:hypothetical protein